MYKDKDKQREAQRDWVRQKRAAKGSTEQGSTASPVQCGVMTNSVDPPPERTAQGNIRVSKPGDADYVPQCETTHAFVEGRPKRLPTHKRGLDIKSFTDLPPDVQDTINQMSTTDGRIDQNIKAKRTAAAIHYQHLFPGSYENPGLSRTSSTKGARL